MATQMQPTVLAYLSDTYRTSGDANIIGIQRGVNERADGPDTMYLDQTLFYPQGGGQPTDQGICFLVKEGDDKKEIFRVNHVVLDGATGIVHHFGHAFGDVQVGQKLFCQVDEGRRLQNARLHSAGHLLFAVVVEQLGYPLVAKKGYHWQKGAYVEFEGTLADSGAETIMKINDALREAIEDKGGNFVTKMADESDAVDAPDGKMPRVVTINGFKASPCGGTHVNHVRELECVRVSKIKCKKGLTKISYSVENSVSTF